MQNLKQKKNNKTQKIMGNEMKKLKRILCFLLIVLSFGFFSACSSGKTPPADNPPPIDNGGGSGGENGGGGNVEPGENDDPEEEPEEPEVYVAYTSNEIMMVGSNFVADFFNAFKVNSTDQDLFDDNVGEMKILFLNTSKMIKSVSEIDNLPYGYCVTGKPVTLDEYNGKVNKVERFYAKFTPENSDGESSVKLRIAFSYNELDYDYDYVYYDVLIETNKKQNIVSCEIGVEWSAKEGADNSTAKYYNISLSGEIGAGQNCSSYNCSQFDRTNNEFSKVDFNNIDNLKQSKNVNGTKTYVGGAEAEILLRNSSSEQSALVSLVVGNLNQGYNMIFRGDAMGTNSTLSSKLIQFVSVATKII
jgi:hypothetical protein